MKRLYLMRHGHSPSVSEAGVSRDALRPLSDKGRADARRMAAVLAKRGAKPGLILHSPLTRAVQTAAEVGGALKPAPPREAFQALDNTKSAEEVAEEIRARAESVDEVLAVGHQPQVGEVAALLGKALFDFRPATVVALEFGPAPRVLWTASPDEP